MLRTVFFTTFFLIVCSYEINACCDDVHVVKRPLTEEELRQRIIPLFNGQDVKGLTETLESLGSVRDEDLMIAGKSILHCRYSDIKYGDWSTNDRMRYASCVKLLLEHGANPNIKDVEGSTPLHLASDKDNDVLQSLIDKGANVNAVNRYKDTPLHIYIESMNWIYENEEKSLARISLLLQHRPNLSAQNCYGKTPLHVSVTAYSYKLMSLLLDYMSPVNMVSNHGHSPLIVALLQDYISENDCCLMVEHLLRAGADPLIKNKLGNTALDIAQKRGWAHVEKTLQMYNFNSRPGGLKLPSSAKVKERVNSKKDDK